VKTSSFTQKFPARPHPTTPTGDAAAAPSILLPQRHLCQIGVIAPPSDHALLNLENIDGAYVHDEATVRGQQIEAYGDDQLALGDGLEDVKFEQRIALEKPTPEAEKRCTSDEFARDVELGRDLLRQIGFEATHIA
jgi:hypothetical protein